MKYGLPKDEKPRKKWKAKMETELRCLKMEICDLKNQLSQTNNKVEEFSSNTAPGKDCPYQPLWDYDKTISRAVRLHSITCMDHYKDLSFEELRFKNYVNKGIGLSNQFQRFKDSQLRSSRTERNQFSYVPKTWKASEKKIQGNNSNVGSSFIIPWYLSPKPPKAPWPFGPLPRNEETSNSPAKDTDAPSSSDFLKEDKSTAIHNQTHSVYSLQDTKAKSQYFSDKELLSTQVMVELKKTNEQIASIDNRLSAMDSNLSELNSRVSIMDSRLSAVDIYVTLERFDKKWQGLESRLVNLETSSSPEVIQFPKGDSETANPVNTNITVKENMSEDAESEEVHQTSEIEVCDVSMKTAIKSEAESFSVEDTSEVNISDFVRSFSCASSGSKSLLSTSTDSCSSDSVLFTKKNEGSASIEMADLKSPSILNPHLRSPCKGNNLSIASASELETLNKDIQEDKINNDELTASNVELNNDLSSLLEESKTNQEPLLPIDSPDKGSDNKTILDDPLGVTKHKQKIIKLDSESNEDDEFVIVEKSDVEESMTKDPLINLNEATSAGELSTFNNITEYLEVNLGKKKDLVYEFGFEAKAGILFEPEGSGDRINPTDETPVASSESPSKEDSFEKFIFNFLGKKSADAKQSTPFVFIASKKPSESPGKSS